MHLMARIIPLSGLTVKRIRWPINSLFLGRNGMCAFWAGAVEEIRTWLRIDFPLR